MKTCLEAKDNNKCLKYFIKNENLKHSFNCQGEWVDKINLVIEEFLLLIVMQMLDGVHKYTLFKNAEIIWLTIFLKLHQKYY